MASDALRAYLAPVLGADAYRPDLFGGKTGYLYDLTGELGPSGFTDEIPTGEIQVRDLGYVPQSFSPGSRFRFDADYGLLVDRPGRDAGRGGDAGFGEFALAFGSALAAGYGLSMFTAGPAGAVTAADAVLSDAALMEYGGGYVADLPGLEGVGSLASGGLTLSDVGTAARAVSSVSSAARGLSARSPTVTPGAYSSLLGSGSKEINNGATPSRFLASRPLAASDPSAQPARAGADGGLFNAAIVVGVVLLILQVIDGGGE